MNYPDFIPVELQERLHKYAILGIDFKYLGFENDYHYIRVRQYKIINGYILSQKQLLDRAKNLFSNVNENLRFRPLSFTLDIRVITPEWITLKMKEFNISRKDILSHLHIDKSTLSLYLKGKRNMSRLAKAAFFWYFLSFEVNRDLREEFMN